MSRLHISKGRVLDPANGLDRHTDVWIDNGHIAAVGDMPDDFHADQVIDAEGCVVCPGLVDLSAHLREPGDEQKATIASETRAAVSAGITTLCCPPDTDPVIDSAAVVELIEQRAEESNHAKLVTLGALTAGLAGEQLAEMATLRDAGCVGVSNAWQPIVNSEVLRRALEYASTFDLTVFVHAEDTWLANNGRVHEGPTSTRLGLPAIPSCAETVDLARYLLLVEQTGARVHFSCLSTAAAVNQIALAQEQGIAVTCDVSAHQLHLTDRDVLGFNGYCHVRPPLRSLDDQRRLRSGLQDEIIDAICSDHQPHEPDVKETPFSEAEPGISALETLLPLTLNLVEAGLFTLDRAIACLTSVPAGILGIDAGTLHVDGPADICIFDPTENWVLDTKMLVSAGHNTPFLGRDLRGRVKYTLVDGELVWGQVAS